MKWFYLVVLSTLLGCSNAKSPSDADKQALAICIAKGNAIIASGVVLGKSCQDIVDELTVLISKDPNCVPYVQNRNALIGICDFLPASHKP